MLLGTVRHIGWTSNDHFPSDKYGNIHSVINVRRVMINLLVSIEKDITVCKALIILVIIDLVKHRNIAAA